MSALKIEFEDGSSLVMYDKNKHKVQLKSVLFSEKVEAPSRTFTFRVPAEPNQTSLKFFNQLDTRTRPPAFKVKCYLGGNFWKYGVLQITDCNEKEYSVRVLIDRGYYSEFGQKSLRSFEYKNPYKFRFYPDQLSSSEYRFTDFAYPSIANVTVTFYLTSNPGTPIVKVFNYNGSVETVEAFVIRISEYFNANVYDFRYHTAPDSFIPESLNIFNLTTQTVPSFYFIITSNNANFTVTNPNNTSVSSLNAHRVFYNGALANPDRDAICFPVAAPNIMTDPTNYWGYLNFYNPQNGQYQTTEQPFVPFPLLKSVIYQLHQEYGIKVAIDQFFDEELSQIVLFNHEKINNDKRLAPNGWRYKEMAVFFYQDIVPDITVSKLVNDFRYFFNTIIDYDSRSSQISIIPVKNILSSQNHIDWTSKFIKGYALDNTKLIYSLEYTWVGEPLSSELLPEIFNNQLGNSADFKSALTLANGFLLAKANKENKYYQYQAGTWVLVAEDLYNYIQEGATNTFKTGATPLFTIEYPYEWDILPATVPNDVKWLLPYTKQTGNMFITDKVAAPHRYMIYRGLANASVQPRVGDEYEYIAYPFGSSHNYDYEGNKVGDYSLAYNAEDGLYTTFWKTWLGYISKSSPVKMKFTLAEADILELNLLSKIMVNNLNYFIDEIEFEIGDSIENCIATCYPIKNPFNE